ncbi:hypothetical protein [Sphaerotilus microaerophilus]|nr:hypothetical protein [Sphaerotilus sp. FB-5]
MDIDEFERVTLRRAATGDMAARRVALALGADALARGVLPSGALRAFLVDGLTALMAVVDTGPGERLTPDDALAFFGGERNPPHRKPNPERETESMALSAAVHLLSKPAGNKSAAVEIVAGAVPCDPKTVWRKCSGLDWSGVAEGVTRQTAAPVLSRVAAEATRANGLYSQEVRDFLSVT